MRSNSGERDAKQSSRNSKGWDSSMSSHTEIGRGQPALGSRSLPFLATSPTLVLSLALLPPPANAQQVVADGVTLTAAGTIDTGTFAPTAGYALYALNGGIITSSSPLTLITGGNLADAAHAVSGGNISIAAGSTITTSGANAAGILSDGSGTIVAVLNGQINAEGFTNTGVTAQNSGAITLNGVNITTGSSSTGVLAQTSGSVTMIGANSVSAASAGLEAIGLSSVIDASQSTQLTVSTGTSATQAILLGNGGLVRLPNSVGPGTTTIDIAGNNTAIAVVNTSAGTIGSGITINLNGGGSAGVYAASSANATLGNLVIEGNGGVSGVLAVTGSNLTLTGSSSITISGGTGTSFHVSGGGSSTTVNGVSSAGLTATNSSTITANDATILVTSPIAVGGAAITGGSVTLTGGSITATGNQSNGVISDATMSLTNVPVTTTGSDSIALEVDGGGHLSVTNSPAQAQGLGASFGLVATGGSAANPNVVTISNGVLTSFQSTAIEAEGAALNISLSSGTQVVGGGGLALNAIGSSIVNLTADASSMMGAAFKDATSTSNVTLQNGSLWTMTGNSNVTSLANDASTINFTPPTGDPTQLASYKTLTTMNYIGTGGTLGLNTFLNSDNSPSDRLVINGGTATGNSFLLFTNTGGPGAQTTANGILVVGAINGATTAAGAFTMANPELRAGAFDYRLFQGGPDGSDPNNWYLRSTFIPPPTPPGPTPSPLPIIGPELATYGVVQPMAQQLARAMLGTHDERLGDLYPVPCEPGTNAPAYAKAPVYTKAPTDCADGWRPAVWGRLFGQQIDNHYQAFADPRTDGQIAGMQVGFDVLRSDSLIAGHMDYGGLYFAYGDANVDVTGLVTNAAATAFVLQHTGSLNLNAYSGGAYWTHYGPQGWYLDLVLQGTSYDGAASTEFAHLNTSGSGFISSLEGGYPIALPQLGFGFVLEPQAQVLWQWVSFDAGNDGLGPVALGTTSETTARVGVKGKWTITTDSGQVWQPYVRANFWSDFGGNPTTVFGVDSVPLISHAQYMYVGGGFTTRINTHLSAFADAGYQFAVSHDGGGKRDGVKGTAGLRYQW